MLEPGYFYGKSDTLISYIQNLEDWILQDIAMRLLKAESVAGTTDMELYKLQQLGLHQSEILKRLSALTKKSTAELRKLLQEAVLTSWEDDKSTLVKIGIDAISPLENPVVRELMDAEYRKTAGEVQNLTRTTMLQTQRDLINMLNDAEIRVAAGVQSYSAAVCELLDQYGKKGVVVNYPTGTRRTLEAAVRMCVVTSMNQMTAQVTNHYILEHEIKYVLVSAHLGARPQKEGQPYLAGHDNWQGRVYKISGSDPDAPNLAEMTGYTIVNGTGSVLNPLGLHGYNCRHSHKPWDKALKNPYLDENGKLKIDTEESRKRYSLQQRQRAMERAIRQTKRQLLVKQAEIDGVAETDIKEMLQPEYDKLAYRLRMQNQNYEKFCADHGLRIQADRVKIAGFKRAQSAKANGRATVYQGSVIKYKGVPKEWLQTKGQKISPRLEVINPNKSTENCANGAVAYEMRQRGLNVIAKDKGIKSLMEEPWKAWDNVEPIAEYSKDDIIELVKTENGNCRYELAFDHKYGSHCVVLEKYEEALSIVDPQLGIRYNVDEYNTEMKNILFWKISDADISKEGVKACRIMN